METLQIICNGEIRRVAPGTTVDALIRELRLDPAQVAVELDGRILARQDLSHITLAADSRLELIRFVGGG